MTHSTVYVTQNDGRLDLNPLNKYGGQCALFGRSIYPDDAEERIKVMYEIAHNRLAKFNPDQDYLALAGDPVSVAMAVSVLTRLLENTGHDGFRVLKWDGIAKGYYEIKIPL